jgi:hypothetical protein
MTSTPAALAFRDYETDGVPGSGPHKPVKSEIRDLFAGVPANFPRAVAVPYAVDPTTDPGATLGVTGRGTISFGAASGYQAKHFNIIINQGTSRVTVAPLGAPSVNLYSGQWCMVANFANTWWTTPKQRYIWSGVALFADAITPGNDTTGDGLAAGAGAYATLTRATQALYNDFDLANTAGTITAGGTFTESVAAAGQPTGDNVFFINGSGPGGFIWKAGAGGYCLLVGDNAELELSNTILDGNGISGAIGFSGHQNMVLDFLTGNTFRTFSSGVHMQTDHGPSVINISGSYSVVGAALYHMVWGPGANVSHAGGVTVTITGTPAIGTWVRMIGAQMLFAGVVTYSGSPAAGCQQFVADFLSVLLLAGTTLPGSVSGSSAHGSQVL